MKIFFILGICVAIALGGTRYAKPGEEREALALWEKYCNGGREGGSIGELFIHCKHPLGPLIRRSVEPFELNLSKNKEQIRTQYIFVKPNSVHFTHKIRVKPSSELEPKTIVYVKPAEFSHTYKSETERTPTRKHNKPELVFLSRNHETKQSSLEDYDDFPTIRPSRQRQRQPKRSPLKVDEETFILDDQVEPLKSYYESLDRVVPFRRKVQKSEIIN